MRLGARWSEAQQCTPHRRRGARAAQGAHPNAPGAKCEAIASMRLLFVGRVGLQPANLAGKFGLLKLDKSKNEKNQPFYCRQTWSRVEGPPHSSSSPSSLSPSSSSPGKHSLSTPALSLPLFQPSLDLSLSLFSLRHRDLSSLREKREERGERAGEEKDQERGRTREKQREIDLSLMHF